MLNARPNVSDQLSTPQRKANAGIDRILRSLVELGLPIPIPDKPSSPSLRGKETADSISSHISYLFWQENAELEKLIQEFIVEFKKSNDTRSSLLTTLETRLRDLACLTKDKPKRSPLKNRLRNESGQKAKSDTVRTTKIEAFYKPAKRRSPDGDKNQNHGVKQQRRDDSWSRSFGSTTTSSTRMSHISSVGSSTRASTAATSFSIHDEAFDDDDAPASTYGSNFDATQSAELTEMGMDFMGAIQRTKSTDTIASESFEDVERQDSANEHLMTELRESSRNPTPPDSPSSQGASEHKHFLLKNLGGERLCKEKLPNTMVNLPFSLQWSIARAKSQYGADLDSLHTVLRKIFNNLSRKELTEAWLLTYMPVLESGQTGKTFYRANLEIDEDEIKKSSNKDHLLQFTPLGPNGESLNRLERRFGAERFLSVTFKVHKSRLSKIQPGIGRFEKDFRKFLRAEQILFGTTFQCFYVEKDKNKKDKDDTVYDIRYFAVKGPGLDPISVEDIMDWALNLKDNMKQPFAKLMSRMSLYLSRTAEALVFSPEQVQKCVFSDDIKADGTLEATIFNDERLKAKFRDPPKDAKAAIMNDGCCNISPAAARQICQQLGLSGNRPVAFQARINGAKGMWFISAPYDSEDDSIWIKINSSQRKVHFRESHLRAATCEPGRWALDVVTCTSMPRTQCLHIDFLPILEDRGVPREVLVDVVDQQLEIDFRNFSEAIADPVLLRKWVSRALSGKEIRNREMGIGWVGGLPDEDLEKAIFLLECGFKAETNAPLAEFVYSQLTWWLQDLLSKLKVRLNKTLMPYGVADNKQCLRPGEVFLAFSEPFVDADTGESFSHLEGDVLVARHPAMRNSDIQRVRAVYKPELSYLRDVVVFPTRGKIPLASKLQGGDYDGDTFWICFDQRIVKHFRNAPAPIGDPKPEKFGIKQNKDTLEDVLHLNRGPRDFRNVIQQLFRIRLHDNQLGKVTIAHRKLAYRYGSLKDTKVNKLADVHDLIIDAAKNGYEFGEADYTNLLKSLGVPASLARPAYEEALEHSITKPEKAMSLKVNESSVIDILVFRHILPQVHAFRDQIRARLRLHGSQVKGVKHEPPDQDLLRPYQDLESLALSNPTAKANLDHLKMSLRPLSKRWNSFFHGSDDQPLATDRYRTVVTTCFKEFQDILPISAQNSFSRLPAPSSSSEGADGAPAPTLRDPIADLTTAEGILIYTWTHRDAPQAPSRWELMRASALYHHRVSSKSKTKFAFTMGGRELGYIKAMSSGRHWRAVTKDMHASFRPRNAKKKMYKGRMVSVKSGGGSDDEAVDGEDGGM